MSRQRTESVAIKVDREMARRLKAACARLRLTESDIFEIGFNATFPRHVPKPLSVKKR